MDRVLVGDGELLWCRRLRCGHVFHLACVDKWSLGATDYSRPVSCAICNQPLVKQQ